MNIKLTVNMYSSTIIEAIESECGLNSTLAFAYFYFDFNDLEKQKYNTLICLLVKQLSWHFQSIPSTLQELYSQKQNGTQKPTLAFRSPFDTPPRAVQAFQAHIYHFGCS